MCTYCISVGKVALALIVVKFYALEKSLEILYFRSSKDIISNTSGPLCYAMFHSVREWKVSSQCFSNYLPGIDAMKKE